MPPHEPVTFSQRIAVRRRRWWQGQHPTRRERALDTVHRAVERTSRRSRDDPDEVWRCCRYWQRTLVNKWNGREFAARHGCRLPELLWYGTRPPRALLESLPPDFVIRPIFGSGGRGTHVFSGGRELLHGSTITAVEMGAELPRSHLLRRPIPILIEGLIRTWPDREALPLEYKCHTFGERVGTVQVTQRHGASDEQHRFHTPQWDLISDPLGIWFDQDPQVRPRPPWLEQMLATASRMGSALGTYMRIDFLASQDGYVFSEFSSIPAGGFGYTERWDEWFGSLWTDVIPEAT